MAIDPVHFVAMPRGLALALSMPLLSALFILFGIGGAYLVGVELLGLDAGSYFASIERSVDFHDSVAQSLLKSTVFGVLVGWLATWRGMSCAPNSAGVSRATTSTVVTASVWILLTDYAITAIWEI
jgi:phospholipid/cholesterol/gamma-HCH transport system permease protein